MGGGCVGVGVAVGAAAGVDVGVGVGVSVAVGVSVVVGVVVGLGRTVAICVVTVAARVIGCFVGVMVAEIMDVGVAFGWGRVLPYAARLQVHKRQSRTRVPQPSPIFANGFCVRYQVNRLRDFFGG